jgi:hypothetical protein
MTGSDQTRKKIHPATQAALWALSNGRCYAPGCAAPVVVEVRPGVYRKNAQTAHIRGVRAPRYDRALSPEECAHFTNLLILCLPHHAEVDDKRTADKLYPPQLLRKWKTDHEGRNGTALAALGVIDEESLTELLTVAFTPPIKRLQQIADQLEKTGTLNAQTVTELRQVVSVMASSPAGPDARIAAMLADAAQLLGGRSFETTVNRLYEAADLMSSKRRGMRDDWE